MDRTGKIIVVSTLFSVLSILAVGLLGLASFQGAENYKCSPSQELHLDLKCHSSEVQDVVDETSKASNVENECRGSEYLGGDGQCYSIDFGPESVNTNDSDSVVGNEYQSLSIGGTGSTYDVSLSQGNTISFTDTFYPDQNISVDSSKVNDSVSIDGGNSVEIDDDYEADTDTNASTECSGDRYLAGGGGCRTDSTGYQTDVYVGKFRITDSDPIEISALPFEPEMVEFKAQAPVNGYNTDTSGSGGDGPGNYAGSMSGFVRDTGSGLTQQVISSGGSGNSINSISYYSSSSEAIGVRYGGQNGGDQGSNRYSVSSLDSDGFTLSRKEYRRNMVVIYTAYDLN